MESSLTPELLTHCWCGFRPRLGRLGPRFQSAPAVSKFSQTCQTLLSGSDMFRSFFHLVWKNTATNSATKKIQPKHAKESACKIHSVDGFLWDEPTSFSGVSGWSESGEPETKSKTTTCLLPKHLDSSWKHLEGIIPETVFTCLNFEPSQIWVLAEICQAWLNSGLECAKVENY